MLNALKLTCLAASITNAMGIAPPYEAEGALEQVDALVKRFSKSGKAQRVLIYNPDAVAFWLYQKYTGKFIPVMERTSMTLPMQAAFPPVTPVCFGSMYTGAMPAVHGIRKYEKPVIQIDSLFDALVRGGKKAALVAVEGSSMAQIFLGRSIDYYSGKNDREAEEIALALIAKNNYDFICVYQMNYDEWIHKTTPESPQALEMLDQYHAAFAALADAVKDHWAKYDTLVVYAPDHGVHETIEGVGDHFADIPMDMNTVHFYGFYPAEHR